MKIALTFDIERDIPNVLDTYFGVKIGLLKILKVLDSFKIKGTFFCTGNVAERLPEYIRLIERKGHEIACHSFNHENLNKIGFRKCQELIYQNKKIIEDTCQNSEVVGFRAPYLRPPKFLFQILNNIGFKYDSSIRSPRMLKSYQIDVNQIQEYYPLNFNALLRLPMGYSLFRKMISKKNLSILCFHPWEAINMKDLILNQISIFDIFKRIMFRPDRVVNTGDSFIIKMNSLIKEYILKKAEFIVLKQLLYNN
ncbi:MAG: polysaccharide deacetylase family protein [Candidatus Hodarchaeota archaeon]